LKYQRFTPLGVKNRGIRKSGFVTKTQFLSLKFLEKFSGTHLDQARKSGIAKYCQVQENRGLKIKFPF